MKEADKFIVRICCEPKIKTVDDNVARFTENITTMRVKLIDEGIIGQLREIMREKNVTELFAIDESKVLQLVKEHKALEIIKEKPLATLWLIKYCSKKTEYEDMASIFKEDITKEQFDLLKEALL